MALTNHTIRTDRGMAQFSANDTISGPYGESDFLNYPGSKRDEFAIDQNALTKASLVNPNFDSVEQKVLAVIEKTMVISALQVEQDQLHFYYKDKNHPRGIWYIVPLIGLLNRRSNHDTLPSTQGCKAILDLDAYAASMNKDWHWLEHLLSPDQKRALVFVSIGGSRRNECFEIDIPTGRVVGPEDGGFFIPMSIKDYGTNHVIWVNDDTIAVSSPIEESKPAEHGYASTVRLWKRGTNLGDAKVLFQIDFNSRKVRPELVTLNTQSLILCYEYIDSRTVKISFSDENEVVIRTSLDLHFEGQPMAGNESIVVQIARDHILDGVNYVSGSVLSFAIPDLLAQKHSPTLIWNPNQDEVVSQIQVVDSAIIIQFLVNGVLEYYRYPIPLADGKGRERLFGLPELGQVSMIPLYEDIGMMLVELRDPLTPSKLYLYTQNPDQCTLLSEQKCEFRTVDIVTKRIELECNGWKSISYVMGNKRLVGENGQIATDAKVLVRARTANGYRTLPGFEPGFVPLYENDVVIVFSYTIGSGIFGPIGHLAGKAENKTAILPQLNTILTHIGNPARISLWMGAANSIPLSMLCHTDSACFSSAISVDTVLNFPYVQEKRSMDPEFGVKLPKPFDATNPAHRVVLATYMKTDTWFWEHALKIPTLFVAHVNNDNVHWSITAMAYCKAKQTTSAENASDVLVSQNTLFTLQPGGLNQAGQNHEEKAHEMALKIAHLGKSWNIDLV